MERAGYYRFELWFRSGGHTFRKCYQDRQVNNINFDTFDLANYSDNLDGISRRSKLRLRWYGTDNLPADSVFEIKQKINSLGCKQYAQVDLSRYSWTDWASLMRQFAPDIPTELLPMRSLLYHPVVLNSYLRSYYEDSGGVRLTVDRDLNVCRVRLFEDLTQRYMVSVPIYRIVEVKYPKEKNNDVRNMLEALNIRPTKYSKYVAAVDRVMP